MKKNFTREEESFWGYVVYEHVHLTYMVSLQREGVRRQRFNPYEEGHRVQFAATMDFIRFLFKKYGDDFKCYHYPSGKDELMRVRKSPEDIAAWLEAEYEAGNYANLEWNVCFDITERLIPKKYIRYIRRLKVPKNKEAEIYVEQEQDKKASAPNLWRNPDIWTIWAFTDEEFAILRDKGVFYFLEYILAPFCHLGVIKDHKKLQGTITALRVKDYQYEPALAKLIEKMIKMMEEAIKRGVGFYFSYWP